ncbi:MFS transporter [Oceanidesulfovibrio indonesiensis]|uniref:MFS transporter n=1 Tax=Oceanidesulfovibrio indonesiensis TaxID=54767 RepID=A0A7M3MHZ2_9BACT|nr:MFS transporter [Oceanidesulfovibrio indonesiensis]TVM18870.1 MFS transporter [Oceanidesulfovibrio indonesiensis]
MTVERGADNRPMYLYLLLLTVAGTVGLQGWRTLINNFAVDTIGLDGFQFGVVQSVREVPGFLALLVIYLLIFFREHRLAAYAAIVLGVGVAATGLMPSFTGVLLTTTVMSIGFHCAETLNQSLTLQYFGPARAAVVFGRLRGVASVCNLAVGAFIFLLADLMDFSWMFASVGAVAVVIGLYCLRLDPQMEGIAPQRKSMVLRRRYWLFYALTFFSGARRQIFTAFAVFLLVQKFGYSVQWVTALFFINNAVLMWAGPAIGRSVARFGERTMLTVEYAGLVAVFLVYAFTDSAILAGAMYVADHLLYNFSIAIRTYFQKIADPGDIAPSMAVGFTINHIAAVVIPFVGGLIWLADYRWVFVGAAVLSLVSLCLAQFTGVHGASSPKES